jgi:inhibitor of cysteine peptidase
MRTSIVMLSACMALAAWPAGAVNPSYDAATGRLDLPVVDIGSQTFSSVVLHLGTDGRYELVSFVAPLAVGAAESGQTLRLKVGQYLEVGLASNPSTGYAWQFDAQSIAVLSQQGDPVYVADASEPPVTGSGGTETWKFKALQAGTGTLRLDYRRSWETGDPLTSVQYVVVVE